jgi:hypothetical protein
LDLCPARAVDSKSASKIVLGQLVASAWCYLNRLMTLAQSRVRAEENLASYALLRWSTTDPEVVVQWQRLGLARVIMSWSPVSVQSYSITTTGLVPDGSAHMKPPFGSAPRLS